MTRQMADDEVLRVLGLAILAARRGSHVSADDLAEARAAVAALQAERDALRAEVGKLQEVVTKFRDEPPVMLAAAVGSVLTKRAERAESALEALRGQVARLVAAANAVTFDTYALTAPETRAAFDGRDSIAVVRIDTLDAFRTALLAIKERMG